MLDGSIVREQNRRGRHHLQVDTIAIHLLQAHFRIPTSRVNMPEETFADQDVGLPGFCVLDRGPVRGAIPRRQIGPRAREKVIVNINDSHRYCLPG